MAVPRKLVVVPNPATRELWRIAESGGTDELETVLPRAEINARNEHGMTALMRAACHGRVEMVRVLLEHGADPNMTRNDAFTALSLAAFFGHAEIVKTLMQHGANPNVVTRFGTSPYIWAKARSFGDVARCLEKRNADFKPAPAVVPTKSLPAQPAPVRTLKEPPEIWDLVQEAPRNFDPRSAFMTRIGSMNGGLLMPVAALLVLVGLVIGAVMFFRHRAASLSAGPAAPVTTVPAAIPVTPVPAPVDNEPSGPANVVTDAPAPIVETGPVNSEVTTTVTRRSRSLARSPAFSPDVNSSPEVISSVGMEDTVAVPRPAAPKLVPREPQTRNPAAPVTHPVIAPPKSAQSKAKVIQWP